jgi:hypothetical protein
MKKQLLTLSLVLMSIGLFSQVSTIWQPYNSNMDTSSGTRWFSVVDTNTVWLIESNGNHPTATTTKFSRTQNGSTFTSGTFLPDTNYYQSSNISAVNDSVAYIPCYSKDATRAGIIMKTMNRGLTWTNVADTSTMFTTAANFPDWAHFYDNNRGIVLGDPNGSTSGGPNTFEIYHTYNGGTSWTRVPDANIAAPVVGDYGVTDVFTWYGNKHLWFGTNHGGTNAIAHVYRSSDTGHTWQSAQITGMLAGVSGLAFRDSLNGLAWGLTSSTSGKFILRRTTDGGITWTTVPTRNKAGTYDISVVPGRNAYMSVGADSAVQASGTLVVNGIVTSITYDDGDTWNILEQGPSGAGINSNPIRMTEITMLDSTHGWAANFADTTNKPLGGGGINKWMGPVIPFSCPLNITGPTNICSSASATLTASGGATSYTWSPISANTASVVVSPMSQTIYTVNSALGACVNSKTYTLNVTVTPTVMVTSSVTSDTIYNVNCAMSPTVTTLGTAGSTATSFSWSPAAGITGTGPTVAAHPTVTTTYTVTGHTGTCTGTATVHIVSVNCTGINQIAVNGTQVSFYPNPSNGMVTVDLTNVKAGTALTVSDLLGNEVYRTTLNSSNNMGQTLNMDLSALPKGVYLFGVSNGKAFKAQKLVIQ